MYTSAWIVGATFELGGDGDPRGSTENLRKRFMLDTRCRSPAHKVCNSHQYPPARVPSESYCTPSHDTCFIFGTLFLCLLCSLLLLSGSTRILGGFAFRRLLDKPWPYKLFLLPGACLHFYLACGLASPPNVDFHRIPGRYGAIS